MRYFFVFNPVWHRLIQAFSWMLVHSLWQGLILTVLCGIALLLTKKQSALLRYNVITTLFFAFLLTCLVTFIWQFDPSHTNNFYNTVTAGITSSSFLTDIYWLQRLLVTFTSYCSLYADFIVITWLVVFLFKVSNMITSILYVKMVSSKDIVKPDAFWIDRLANLSLKLNINKQVKLLESAIVKIPFVTGYFKPVIFIPLALLANLPPAQVEAVLMHELAHIRRNDYLVNFLQNIAETIFFFNPALLWISALMKEEREHCCDDIAIDHTKNKKQFLEALISFKEYANSSASASYIIAFPGKGNQLVQRFKRIVTSQNKSLAVSEKIFLAVSLFICAVFFAAVSTQDVQPQKIDKKTASNVVVQVNNAKQELQELAVVSSIPSHVQRSTKKRLTLSAQVTKALPTPGKMEEVSEPAIDMFAENKLSQESLQLVKKMHLDADKTEFDKERAEFDRLRAEDQQNQALLSLKLSEQKKMQSIIDAQQAYTDKLEAERKFQQSSFQKSQSIIMKDQALMMKKQAEQDYQKLKNQSIEKD